MLADAEEHLEVLRSSGLDWTAVRGPRLLETPGTGTYRVGWLEVATVLGRWVGTERRNPFEGRTLTKTQLQAQVDRFEQATVESLLPRFVGLGDDELRELARLLRLVHRGGDASPVSIR